MIESPMHLVNVLGYLSKQKSRCNFSLKKDKSEKKSPPQDKQFYIFTTLPTNYKLPVVVLWKEGLEKLMYQELFQNVSLGKVIEHPLKKMNAQWRQKIDDFYALPHGLLLPVDPNMIPVDAVTPRFVYLLNGRKQHFELLPEDPETRLAKQREMLFYEAVGNEWWTPRQRDQKILNLVMPPILQHNEMQLEMNHMQLEMNYLKKENERFQDQLKCDN